MSYKDVTPGDKLATVDRLQFIKSPTKGTPGIQVFFYFEEPSTGGVERLAWVAWLSPAAMERSMETLVEVLEYNGSEVTDGDGFFTDPNVVNFKKEVRLVVEMETNPNDGKQYPRIKWVNNVGGGGFAGVQPEIVKTELGQIGFKAAFLAAKQNAGPAKPKTQGRPNPGIKNYAPGAADLGPEPAFTDEEIPF